MEISDAESFKKKLPYLIFGGIGTAAGITIYFVMPLAVLTADLGLLFEIFFLILVGMILGLALISLNIQRILENIVVSMMIFYESKSMKIMVLKNLSVHRENNRMTAIIYSLTLGTIIFIIVMANIQIAVATNTTGSSVINFKIINDDFK